LGGNVLVWKNKQFGYNVLTVNDLTHIWYLEIPNYEYGNIQSYILASHILLLSGSVYNTHYHSGSKTQGGWNVFQEQIVIKIAISWSHWGVLPYLYHLI
jgi:ubiquitin C-terminal hydrolase